MTILGLDPGLATTGFGILQDNHCLDYGIVSSPPGTPTPERIRRIVDDIGQIVRRYQPDACAVETLFFKAVGARSVILTAQLRGGLFYLMAKRKIPITEITPATLKLVLTGNGRAAKSQMQYMVRALLGIREKLPDHAADALAAAYCAAKRIRRAEISPRAPSRPSGNRATLTLPARGVGHAVGKA